MPTPGAAWAPSILSGPCPWWPDAQKHPGSVVRRTPGAPKSFLCANVTQFQYWL